MLDSNRELEKVRMKRGPAGCRRRGAGTGTAGQLIEQLNNCNGDIGAVIGDCNPEAGAWIRFNPLDGKGCKMKM